MPETQSRTLVNITKEKLFFAQGALVKFLSTPDDNRADLFLMEGDIPALTYVPLHKHPDPEIFCVVEGSIQYHVQDGSTAIWRTASAGDVVNIPGNTKHAFRNQTQATIRTHIVSGAAIYHFFREIVEPYIPAQRPTPPSREAMQKLFAAAAKYHYWMGSPEENAAIGIVMPPVTG